MPKVIMPKTFFRLAGSFLLVLIYSSSVLAAELSSTRPERVGMSSERLQRLDATLKSYVENDQLAGQVVLVLRNGRIAYSAANGMQDIEAGIPMRKSVV